jgi:hypothetical protein
LAVFSNFNAQILVRRTFPALLFYAWLKSVASYRRSKAESDIREIEANINTRLILRTGFQFALMAV